MESALNPLDGREPAASISCGCGKHANVSSTFDASAVAAEALQPVALLELGSDLSLNEDLDPSLHNDTYLCSFTYFLLEDCYSDQDELAYLVDEQGLNMMDFIGRTENMVEHLREALIRAGASVCVCTCMRGMCGIRGMGRCMHFFCGCTCGNTCMRFMNLSPSPVSAAPGCTDCVPSHTCQRRVFCSPLPTHIRAHSRGAHRVLTYRTQVTTRPSQRDAQQA